MAILSLLSVILPVAKGLHMSISATVITVKTSTLTTSNRRSNRRRGWWHRSSKMSSWRTSSQNKRRPQQASIPKMSLLITNLNKSMKRLKLIMKLSQKVIGVSKLKGSLLILAWLISGRRQLRTKSVDLTPNSRELIQESINCSITLAKKLLLMNNNKKSILSSGLIAISKKSLHPMSPLKLHNINRKLILHTSCKNQIGPSILI
jgi:hypothetical protein